ncbi:hypothetical protein GCM10010289_41910 [Streptomyces violascens]|uniref:Uncharacterized protein n=1 Tax=Streptomyces violascens TaxID=67381 RepID=A0ABQ3QZK5_9ACTN|nr:hypothetical protein GCM10010289_41910 [Streptomyces violascens]GHI42706.1 hypothetical protein Sviol_71140 [Streptomyces violascens]
MTVRFEICHTEESMEISAAATVWGGVWVNLDGCGFPEADWNDLPVALACEFLRVSDRIRRAEFKSHRVHFFDGPFWVEFERVGEGKVEVSVGGGSPRNVVLPSGDVVAAIRSYSAAILTSCLRRGWGDTADVRDLKALHGDSPGI